MEDYEEPEAKVDSCHISSSPPRSNPHLNGEQQLPDNEDHDEFATVEIVEETQFDDLEPVTQDAQDSFGSRVPETQWVTLEPDTQAVDDPSDSAAPSSSSHSASQPSPSTAIQLQLAEENHFKRPDLPSLDDSGKGFKFALAAPRLQNPAKRPTARPAAVVAAVVNKGTSLPEPVLESNGDVQEVQPLAAEKTSLPKKTKVKAKPYGTISPILRNVTSDSTHGPELASHAAVPRSAKAQAPVHESRSSQQGSQKSRMVVEVVIPSVKLPPSVPSHTRPVESGPVQGPSRRSSHDSEGLLDMPDARLAEETPGEQTTAGHSQASKKSRQRALSRGRQKIKQPIKKPFPDAVAPAESRRWSNQKTAQSNNINDQLPARKVRPATPSNTSRARLPNRVEDAVNMGNPPALDMSLYHWPIADLATPLPGNETIIVPDDEVDHNISAQSTVGKSATTPSEDMSTADDDDEDDCMPGHTDATTIVLPPATHVPRVVNSQTPPPHATMYRSTKSDTSPHIESRPYYFKADEALAATERLQNQARRSDHTKLQSRPLAEHQLKPADAVVPRSSHSNKVKKTSKSNKQNVALSRPKSPAQHNQIALDILVQSRQHTDNGIQEFFRQQEEKLASREAQIQEQEACIASQREELEQQAALIESKDAALQTLDEQMKADKATLAPKYHKIISQGQKYALHMNDVVEAQKWLKNAAEAIDKRCVEAHQLYAKSEKQTEKLQKALLTSKEIRQMAADIDALSNEKQKLLDDNANLVTEGETFKEKLEALDQELQQLKAAHAAQSTEKATLASEKATLMSEKATLTSEKATLAAELEKSQIETSNAMKLVKIHEQTINDRIQDLQTEKHNTEQLVKNLAEQTATWNKIVEVVKQVPADTSELLTGNDGTVSKLFASESTTQEKVEEMTSVIKEYVKREPELPEPIVKLMQDIATRLETENQLAESNGASLKDAATSICQELKENMDQLRLDKETEIRLNSKITELERARESLNTLKIARDTEVENLSRQLEESRRELSGCRSDLSNKNNELTSALNAPREDPTLRSKISELEQAKAVIEQQVKSTNQELSKVKEDLSSAKKIASSKEEECRAMTEKLNNAQQTIKHFNEGKIQALKLQEEAHSKSCQELVKNMESQKATIKMKLESEAKTLELRVKEKTDEIQALNVQLQNLQEAAENNSNLISEAEVLTFKEQTVQLVAGWQYLQDNNPGNQDSTALNSLKSVQDEIAGLKHILESGLPESTRIIEAATKEQQDIEESLRALDAAQQKKILDMQDAQSRARSGVSRAPVASYPLPHLRAASNMSADDMLLDNSTLYTPEKILRHGFRAASSMLNTSPHVEKQSAVGKQSSRPHMSPTGAISTMAHSRGHRPSAHSSSMMSSSTPTRAGTQNTRLSLLHLGTDSPQASQHFPSVAEVPFSQQSFKESQQSFTATQVIHPGDEPEQTGPRPSRSVKAHNNAPTIEEESISRRNSQQPKSVLKKTTRLNITVSESSSMEAQHGPARASRSNSGQSTGPAQINNIKGFVSGRPAGQQAVQGLSTSNHLFETQQSPLMDAPNRNRNKRIAPTALESSKTKVARRRPTSSQTSIPETQ